MTSYRPGAKNQGASRSNSRAKVHLDLRERRHCNSDTGVDDLAHTAQSLMKQTDECIKKTKKRKLKAKKEAKDEIYNPILRLIKAYNY